MKLFNKQNWLRGRVKKVLHLKHAELFIPPWKHILSETLQFCFHRNQWWLIATMVLLCFYFGTFIPIEKVHFFSITPETAKILVDQRASNIATIISITLVVVGFLINNIAIKEAFAYKLLFRHSYLYPIIYLILSTIGCFVITSTVRDGIDRNIFVRAVFIGTCFVWLILIMIGLLFRSIINFTNPKGIDELFHRELIKEAADNLKFNLSKIYSRQQLKAFMDRFGVMEFNIITELAFGDNDRSKKIMENISSPDRTLYDINMKALEEYIIKNNDNTFYYFPLALGDLFAKKADLIWPKISGDGANERDRLRNCVILRKVPVVRKDKLEVRKYFDQKLEDAVAENKFRSAEKMLLSYLELYQLDIRNNPNHD